VVIWGLVPVATRYFVATTDPLAFNVIRFIASGLGALVFVFPAKPWRWPRGDLVRLVVASVLAIPAYNIPVAIAAKTVSAGVMGLLIATEPVFILIFSVLVGRAGVRPAIVLGAVLAFAGVGLTAADGWSGAAVADPMGIALTLFGCAAWALYSVLAAPLVRRHGPWGVAGSILAIGGGGLVAVSLPAMGPHAWPGPMVTVELVALGLVSAFLAFLLWNKAAQVMPVSRLGLFLYLIPVVSLVGGAALLGERLTFATTCGGVLILIGVAVGEGRSGALLRRRAPGEAA
jgi:drug/metabolite transporter (DMT)-like permease